MMDWVISKPFSPFIALGYFLTQFILASASLPPYFFLCNYQGRLDPLPRENDKLFLSVTVDGEPTAYASGETYRVRISSSKNFNGLLVTGLFSSKAIQKKIDPLSYGISNFGFGQSRAVTSDFLCGLVYSEVSPHRPPKSEVEFYWTAPPTGTGCVSFMLTGSLGMQILFQDVVAYQICEEGRVRDSRPSLADIHSDGVILRDDFDSEESAEIWSQGSLHVSFNTECGEITHGKASVFCSDFPRQLISPSLNLTSASAVQFTTGTGSCNISDVVMTLSYRLNTDEAWTTLKRLLVDRRTQVNIIQLPQRAKTGGASLKFSQDDVHGSSTGCWGLDNVLITETENRPTFLYDNLDPIDTSKWLFMPSANVQGDCMSQGSAFVFSSVANETGPSYAVTRDINLFGGAVEGLALFDSEIIGGSSEPLACGHTDASSTFSFKGSGPRSFCITPADDLENIVAVRLVLSMGSGNCHFNNVSDARISLIGSYESSRSTLAEFDHDLYKTPKQVTVQLPYFIQRSGGILCLRQNGTPDIDQDVWAISSFELIPRQENFDNFVQFSINTKCSSNAETSVNVEYSNDFGRSWHLLQEECMPETCSGHHWPYKSVYKSNRNQGWLRVTLPLPVAALTKHTRLRWVQSGAIHPNSRWALDNIYIGPDEMCPEMCNGRGLCNPDECRCDTGWIGLSCNVSLFPLPHSLSASFNSMDELHNSFVEIYGAQVGFDCGLLGAGKALVFKDSGRRMLITMPHNGVELRYLQFAILMGRYSSVGTCQAPEIPGDGVLIHYTTNRGISWNLLEVVPFDSERRTKVISIPLPPEALVAGLQIRWLQPNENLQGKSVWAIDDVILSSELYKSIFSTPKNFKEIYTTSVSFHTGIIADYCNMTNVLLFSPQSAQYSRTLRYAETQTMETSEGYVLEADINLQCDSVGASEINRQYDPNHELHLQYSKDAGVTWHLVHEENLPGSSEEESFHPASVYHISEFGKWTTAVLPMPRNTWSSHVRLRVVQNHNSDSTWALNNVYMGPACPMHCRNRGRCRNGKCQCNEDSVGPTCLSRTDLPTGVDTAFVDIGLLRKNGWNIIGASLAAKKKSDCGAVPAASYLLFDKPGIRKLSTPDLDTSLGGQIQFYLRISDTTCKVPSERANGVLLQYSNNGGITWKLLNELYYMDYALPKYVHRDIPEEAQTKQTRFRWWQPRNNGVDQESWSIADVIVGDPVPLGSVVIQPEALKISSRRSVDDYKKPKTFILLSNEGSPGDFCDPRTDSHVFNKVKGDRFAVTDDLILNFGDTIQFEINVGCTDVFSRASPVRLQFSQDEGYSWKLVLRSCYPDGRPKSQMKRVDPEENLSPHDCTGVARQLTEPSVYHQGEYSTWRRITIPVDKRLAAMPLRLRWYQHVPTNISSDSPLAVWAIRSIHIGRNCPLYCNGHGRCVPGMDAEGTCICDRYYSGELCQTNSNPINGFWDHFSPQPNPIWWNNILGLTEEGGCGNVYEDNSLYFGGNGARKAETVSLNTSGIRMIQFYLRIGSTGDSDTCQAPEDRDEAVLLQYSNDNGISWNLIKELSFDAFSRRGERVIVGIPFPAKTPWTSFRWWQPLRDDGEHRSQWALDDVFIGGPDLFMDTLAEDFNAGIISEISWHRIRGGSIGQFQQCIGEENSDQKALVITSSDGVAETWDFRLKSGSFLQFDIVLSCKSNNPANDVVSLEYSSDLGETWQPVIPQCTPASTGCEYGIGTLFYAAMHQQWTRRTIALPEALTRSAKIRFRWIQHFFTDGFSSWAIDNVYIGNGCPWMCNGHGRCWPESEALVHGCTCDSGFDSLPYCQATEELRRGFMDSFDQPGTAQGDYLRVIGHDVQHSSSREVIVNNENLLMKMNGIRILETVALNTLDTKYIQFHLTIPEAGRTVSEALVLQSSRNGGITWSTIHLSHTSSLRSSKNLVHVVLPAHSRHDAVSFRLWQTHTGTDPPIFGRGEDTWAIDNLLIGGRVSGCDKHVLEDDFAESPSANLSSWLHHNHINVAQFCASDGNAFVVEQIPGTHAITTNDLCISENYVLQFKIAVGCSSDSLDQHAVRLEYSTDHGVSWSLLKENCDGTDPISTGCTEELHPSSIFYSGTTKGWRRVVIPMDKHKCGSLRFRWYQGFYPEGSQMESVPWAIDDVYIGPACDQMCNGHGVCKNEGESCICDAGYGGNTCCDIVSPNPAFFQERFDATEDALNRSDIWSILSGGKLHMDSQHCEASDSTAIQWSYKVDGPGERVLETRDLDLRDGESVQFYVTFTREEESDISGDSFLLKTGKEEVESVEEFLYVQFSTDGGIAWSMLQILPLFHEEVKELQYIATSLPETSRTNATRLRWWQPRRTEGNEFGFTIDQIFIGGSLTSLDDEFDSPSTSSNWVELSGAKLQPEVGSKCCNTATTLDGDKCDLLEIGSGSMIKRYCDTNFVSTNGVNVSPGSFISFNLNMNCQGDADHCEGIELQYSTDLGNTWTIVVPPCYPSNSECDHFNQGTKYFSDVFPSVGGSNPDNRIIVPVPEQARSPSTRFRWLQTSPLAEAWSIDNVYIGIECSGACSGHGRCHNRQCLCDDGWAGMMCHTSTVSSFPTELKNMFPVASTAPGKLPEISSKFAKIVGAHVDKACGEIGYDYSLHFFKSCSRLLETVAMNTTMADFVQFMFRTGCGETSSAERDEGVLVDYTTNGGAIWHNLAELYFKNHGEKPSFVNILLPQRAKTVGTKFRWWQPRHSGLNHDDWALDNLLIAGKREEMMLSDDFSVTEDIAPAGLWLDRDEKEMWQFYDNTESKSFCGRDNVILGGAVPGLDVTVSTKDFVPKPGFLMQYTIVVHCEDVQIPHQPVHVQYSADFGDTWQYLAPQCIASDRGCFGKEITQPSAHFISRDWRRKTIWIPSFLYNQPVRFRFHQDESDVMWALDKLYIGPSCPDACSGHGDCVGVPQENMFTTRVEVNYDARRCLCDFGYEGPNCYLDFERNRKFLKDDFNAGEQIGSWFIIEPKRINIHCGLLFDGYSITFNGVGPRQAETEDLDLRDATFVQYRAAIGHNSDGCLPAKQREDGLLMQYSIDGGISWHLLRELDYESYGNSTHDYISLPLEARTNATRLRWWQPFEIGRERGLAGMGQDRANWALDNVYIGGQEVNEHSLEEDFEVGFDSFGGPGALDETKFEFYPNGRIGEGQCAGDNTSHMMWSGTSEMYPKQSITTRQLLITPGHMIQFKIKVGCTDAIKASRNFPIRLEYRENPRDNNWYLVKPRCYPAHPPTPLCTPYTFHDPSVYNLEYKNFWRRITIPLDRITSGLAQFRWMQDDHAPEIHSWAIDDLYIGEACPEYCSGHGKCTKLQECVCDNGYGGNDCSLPLHRYVVPVFRDSFEAERPHVRFWSDISGGRLTSNGCGPLHPHGFSRSVYFSKSGLRQMVTQEMDLSKAWRIEYVLQLGSNRPNTDCQVYVGDVYGGVPAPVVVLQYTTNNGVTWHTLREHDPTHYGVPLRVTQRLPTMATTKTTKLRWWQPSHQGEGYDQWAVDNVDITMSRRQRHYHFLDYEAMLRQHGSLPSLTQEINPQPIPPESGVKAVKKTPIEKRRPSPYQERLPPESEDYLP